MNNMFYLIRINRRDKPHSRIRNDSPVKNNSCPGNERANFNYRENQGRKAPGTSEEEEDRAGVSVPRTENRGT